MFRLLIATILLSGCTVVAKQDPEVDKALKQHTIVLNALTQYIADCQAKGICPKPDVKKEDK